MARKMSIEAWMKACEKAIEAGNTERLQAVLGYLDEQRAFMVIQYQDKLLRYAADRKQYEMIRIMMEHEKFNRSRAHGVLVALEYEDAELLKLAMDYAGPNVLLSGNSHGNGSPVQKVRLAQGTEGSVYYYMTAEALAFCAIRGNRELAEILLERGARPDGETVHDFMGKRKPCSLNYSYFHSFSNLQIVIRGDRGSQMFRENCREIGQLPPWAYAMFSDDVKNAEFFLGLGEDRYTVDLAMAISMVSNGEIIRILQEKKPNLMNAVEPEFILRRFWPEAVKQYFASGKELPKNAVQLMGSYVFDEHRIEEAFDGPVAMGLREDDFLETLTFLLKKGYRLTKDDIEYLTLWMILLRSERLLQVLKGNLGRGIDVSDYLDLMPVSEKDWKFGKKLEEAGVKFRCVLDEEYLHCRSYGYMELARLFKLVEIELKDPRRLDPLCVSALGRRSKKSMALLWKKGLINGQNLTQATKFICEFQMTELYELAAELAGTMGGSEVRYEL